MDGWQIHRIHRELGQFAEAWDALNCRSFHDHPMLSSKFVNSLLQHFSRGDELICIHKDQAEVNAMCIVHRHMAGLWATFLPSQAQIAPSLLPDISMVHDLLRRLPAPAWSIDLLCIDSAFTKLSGSPNPKIRRIEHARTISIPMTGGFEDYWNHRPKKLASNMRRYLRRSQEETTKTDFRVITAPEEIEAAVLRYAELEASGWKGEEGTALAPDNQQFHFYREVMYKHAVRQKALIFELWFESTLVASRLVILRSESVVFLKTTYKETHARLAPGRILLQLVIQTLFERYPGRKIEFYTNADNDLLAWGVTSRHIVHLSLVRHAMIAKSFAAARQLRQFFNPQARQLSTQTPEGRLEHYLKPSDFPADVLALMRAAEIESTQFGADWYEGLLATVMTAKDEAGFFVYRKGEHALIVLPVRIEFDPKRGRRHMAPLGNYYTALYAPALAPEANAEDMGHMFRLMLAQLPKLHGLRFSPMAQESAAFHLIGEGLRQAGLKTHEYFCFGNWFENIAEGANYDQDLQSSNSRSTIRRRLKKLLQEKGRLEIISQPEDLDRGLKAYTQVYSRSWKQPEPYIEFIPSLMRTCAANGWLRLGLVWLEDVPIAAQLWIVAHGRADIYKLAYDEDYKHLAPGSILSAELMKHVIDVDRVREVDYLIGDDPYKKRWVSQRRERWGWMAYNTSTPQGMWDHARECLIRFLRPLLASLKKKLQPNQDSKGSELLEPVDR
ncbi:GNAT family N-acetyltransferase [Paucibacter sp. DJ1R-11]|uniref:GNAT family N-acetyltransferase n=1 Tax=Paucibacter sp. DJ1R-11 TaxID=2893556 RepID=UPI0021E4277F|nr:GNAT family N-acetyltransferase [Paucibacter sp. DJ1R-11]MCV2364571.1 GNAT family N-acetyltransferase [Paucibacter sp. DJ1R-11]